MIKSPAAYIMCEEKIKQKNNGYTTSTLRKCRFVNVTLHISKNGQFLKANLEFGRIRPNWSGYLAPLAQWRRKILKNMERFTNLRVILAQGPC